MKKIRLLMAPLMAVSLLASCGVKEHFVTFESNGGDHVVTQRVKEGAVATLPTPEPKRGKDAFKGWFTDNETFEHEYTFTNPVTDDVTLYAKWEKATYTITFKNEGDDDKKIENIQPDSLVTEDIPTPTEKPGFDFIGWCTDEKGKNIFDFNTVKINQDYTLYAGWKKIIVPTYTISFNGYNCRAKVAAGGDEFKNTFQTTISDEDDNLVLTLQADIDYSLSEGISVLFDGKEGTPNTDYLYNKGENKLTIIKKADALVTLYALNSKEICYVKFDAGDGNVIEGTNERYKYYEAQKGISWSDLGNSRGVGAKQNGKDFAYWTMDGENYIGEDYKITGNITLKPKFVDINTNDFAVHARTDNVKLAGTSLLDSISSPIKYTIDGVEDTLEKDEEINLSAGEICYFKSENATIYVDTDSKFIGEANGQSGLYHMSGHLNSLINGSQSCPSNAFVSCFNQFKYLVSAEHLILLNDTNEYCYYMLFGRCASLLISPSALTAPSLSDHCYSSMFGECGSLIVAPHIYATTAVGSYCCSAMFTECHLLMNAPDLPILDLSNTMSCYDSMFHDCTSLVKAPVLPATKLGVMCYSQMFQNCSSLTKMPTILANTFEMACCQAMFRNCTSLISVPILPSENLAKFCYRSMFVNCSSLKISVASGDNFIFECPDTSTAEDAVKDMFASTGGTFKGTPVTGSSYYWNY